MIKPRNISNARKGLNSSSLELGNRHLRVVATHREMRLRRSRQVTRGRRPSPVGAARGRATKHPCQGIAFGESLRSGDMSDREAEFENGIGDCWVRGFDRINGINRIGRSRRGVEI